jgi:L-amino acid N-acyltransferase YncA
MTRNRTLQSSDTAFQIRAAQPEDAAAISSIYGVHVSEGAGTFEEVAPATDEIRRRMVNVRARGLPWVVAEAAGRVIGYCYASPYHARSAYRFTVQTSVYVVSDWQHRSVGLSLLNHIADACRELGYCQIMAAVGDSHNDAALRLHARAGFRTIGHAVRVGVKFGRWTDIVYMQRFLDDPAAPPPARDPQGYISPSDQTGP